MLCAGTSKPIPRRKWDKHAPSLSVESLAERDEAVRAHFLHPEIQVIGSTSGCGCDFLHTIFENQGSPEIAYQENFNENAETASTHKHNREALVELLRAFGENVIELYGLWDGDFAAPTAAHEDITLETILEPSFRFKERGFYRVTVRKVQ
jgi:hypothetical protein